MSQIKHSQVRMNVHFLWTCFIEQVAKTGEIKQTRGTSISTSVNGLVFNVIQIARSVKGVV